jgi:hypothetical protein
MESYFVRLGDQYTSNKERIREALANFKSENKAATHWAQVLLRSLNQRENNQNLASWESFKAHFMEQFSDPNKKAKAESDIRKCKQNNSVANYASEFRYLLVDVNWGQEALINQFKEGLKSEVKTELARFELTLINEDGTERELSLDRWISIAISIDQKLQQIKTSTGKKAAQPTTSGQSSTKRLPDEVYKARIATNRCLKCGQEGHRSFKCPSKEWITTEPSVKGREATIGEDSGKEGVSL